MTIDVSAQSAFPALSSFLRTWFNQDWAAGKRNAAQVVHDFAASNSRPRLADVAGDLDRFLALAQDEPAVQAGLEALGLAVYPPALHLTWIDFGQHLLRALQEELANPALQRMPIRGAYWWSVDPAERLWVEIRKQPGIGIDLRAPRRDRLGHKNAWYELLDSVRAGDLIYHWSVRERRFVGLSFATAPRRFANGERVVELAGFEPLERTVDLGLLRRLQEPLARIQNELATKFPASRLYLPFQFRSDGLRLMSNYFAKLPVRMAALIFGDESVPAIDKQVAARTQPLVRRQFLHPFEPRADSKYVALSQESAAIRDRSHQTLVNAFSMWLTGQGRVPGANQAIDIGLTTPPVVIEAKAIRGTWAQSIRQAVGQLYEYRYFQVVSSAANLLFLASERVPDEWLRYLERDRNIAVAWMEDDGNFYVTQLAREFLGLGVTK